MSLHWLDPLSSLNSPSWLGPFASSHRSYSFIFIMFHFTSELTASRSVQSVIAVQRVRRSAPGPPPHPVVASC
eukprot:scaffold94903_cov66-Phaeocystis_antarctica.AAC.3